MDWMSRTKILIVGDEAIGKTCLINRFTNQSQDWNDEEPEYEPTTFNNFQLEWELDDTGEALTVEMWDTAGQESFEQLRKLSYPGTDLFLIGYSTTSKTSLNNIEQKWLPEIKENCPDTDKPWFIMVGTKKDIRSEVSVEAAKELAAKIGACALVDTSAKDNDEKLSGVGALTALMKKLAFMKSQKQTRPNWGDFEPKAHTSTPAASTPAASTPAASAPAAPAASGTSSGSTPATASTDKPTPRTSQKEPEDPGCKCVIA